MDDRQAAASQKGSTSQEPEKVGEPGAPAWLSIVGIGDDGLASLGEKARRLIEDSDVLIGGERHLAMIPDFRGERLTWRRPLETTLQDIEGNRGKKVVVLASGDPLWFGVGELLAKNVQRC